MNNHFIKGYTKRAGVAALNSISQMLPSITGLLTSIIVVRLYGADKWGMVVNLQLTFAFALTILLWGSKEYLLKEFSKRPAEVSQVWRRSIYSRLVFLLIPISFLLLLVYPISIAAHLIFWLFSRYIIQAFEVIGFYKRSFIPSLIAETASFVFILAYVFLKQADMSLNMLLLMFSCCNAIRLVLTVLLFRWSLLPIEISFRQIAEPGLFFLLSISGFVSSRIDIYILDYCMNPSDLAIYQVFTSMLLLLRSGSSFILYPYVRNIYRLNKTQIRKMCTSTFYIGSLIGAIGCVFIWFALRYFYLFDLPWYDFVLAAMAVVFGFTFAPVVFYLFGLNRQWNVIGIDVICFLVNAIISFALIPHMGITGALLAVAASQLLMALLYLYKVR